jgi:heme/copper-type cytochrome/quinol oxidase subunit 2
VRLRCTLLTLVMLAASLAWGQCSMCATGAQAADKRGQAALRRGIIVLAIPPVGILLALVGVAFRYRRDTDEEP